MAEPGGRGLYAAVNEAIGAARETGAREALSSLAADLDRLADETFAEARAHATRDDDDAALMASAASDAWRGAAARARARSASSEASNATPVSREDLELTGGLSPAQAYMAGVKAERRRIATDLERRASQMAAEGGKGDGVPPFTATMAVAYLARRKLALVLAAHADPSLAAHFPELGPCLLCATPGLDQRHRVIDAIAEQLTAGESPEELAGDYAVSLDAVQAVQAWALRWPGAWK
jgi:hypothetical protein